MHVPMYLRLSMRAARLSGPGWAARSGYVELILARDLALLFHQQNHGQKFRVNTPGCTIALQEASLHMAS